MDELRSRTAAMLEALTDDQVMLVQDYARYLKDQRAWSDAAALLNAHHDAGPRAGHALEGLLEERS
jgi:hypothetical protein